MTHSSLAAITMIASLVVGCASRTAPPAAEPAARSVDPQGPVIVRLVGQHPTITVTSTPDGPRYSAKANDGRTIVANATLDELRAQHPEIYKYVEPGVALDASGER
jgi:hypothetical protein